MENLGDKGSEQGSKNDAAEKLRAGAGEHDLQTVRELKSAAAADGDKHLPGLSVEKTADEYKAKEQQRAEEYARQNKAGGPLDRTMLTLSALPEQMKIEAKPGQLKIESSGFARMAEAIPGAALDKTFRTMLDSLKSASLEGGRVQAEASGKVPIEVMKGVFADLVLKNPNFDVVADAANPNRITLDNIKGVSIDKLGMGGDIKKVTITMGPDGMDVEIPRPEQKVEAKPAGTAADYLHRFGSRLNNTVGAMALPELIKIHLPLATTDGAQVVQRAFDGVRNFVSAPEKNNPADLAAGIAGLDLKTVLGGAFDGIKSVSKDADRLVVEREKATRHEIGGLPVELAGTIKAKIDASGKAVNLSQIEGVSFNLPLPEQVARAAGLGYPVRANLKEASISEPDKNGERTLTVKTDSVLESVQIKVGADMRPVMDAKGNMSIDFSVKNKDVSLPLSVSFNPAQLEKPPANGPDFKLSLKSGDASYVKLIETISGSKIDSPFKEMITGVSSISKEGDRIQIAREQASSHDLGGVKLDAGKNIRFRAVQDGPSGVRISNIEGINLRLPVELPGIVKDLGIDPGKEIYTSVKTLGLSSPDAQGRRNVLLETDHLLRQVGVMLGPDMKPALDPKGNWYLYGLVDNPVSSQKLPMVLRFDGNNRLAMSSQELMRIGSLAAWQGTDNGGVAGVGFGMIAVGTEAGAIALDVKDKVVDGAVYVKDKVVEGAVIAKDAVVVGATVAKDLAVDAACATGHAFVSGASTVGGWISKGWHYVW